MKRDPLQTLIKQRSIPLKNSTFFKEKKLDLDTLGLSYSQRIMLFVLSVIIASFLFFIALTQLLTAILNPSKFLMPYLLANIIIFNAPGLIFGFKSYYKNVYKKERGLYTCTYVISTVMTMYIAMHSKLLVWICFMVQMCSLLCVIVSFVPGGMEGLKSLVRLIIKK